MWKRVISTRSGFWRSSAAGLGPHELICHPGEAAGEGDTRGQSPRYQRTAELASLTSAKVRRALEQRDISLCKWGDLF